MSDPRVVATGLAHDQPIGEAPFGQRAISTEPGMGESELVLNFGPQHPATHGTLRIVMHLEGERVQKLEQEIGYLHTGFEKFGESRTFNQFIVTTDRMNYMSAMSNNVGFALAVEDLLKLEAPPRAQAIRVIMAELSRIADHIICVGLQAMDLGAFSVMLWGFIEREKIYDVFELASGGRLTTSYTRVGGLAFDIPDDFIPRVKTFLSKLPPVLDEIETVLSRNRIFLDRTKGIGAITREQAIAWGVTGPLARAAGVDRDLRRDEPYSGYKNYSFEVPLHANGDVYDRYVQRVDEIRQSIRIVEQAIEKMPQGPINALNEKVVLPGKDDTYTKMESLIHHFMIEMPGFGQRGSKGEVYSATESPNGELGWFIIGDGSAVPYRVRCRPPSFYNYQAFQVMAKNALVSDVVSCLGSMNVIAGELDR